VKSVGYTIFYRVDKTLHLALFSSLDTDFTCTRVRTEAGAQNLGVQEHTSSGNNGGEIYVVLCKILA
jgi:hypothetical protein